MLEHCSHDGSSNRNYYDIDRQEFCSGVAVAASNLIFLLNKRDSLEEAHIRERSVAIVQAKAEIASFLMTLLAPLPVGEENWLDEIKKVKGEIGASATLAGRARPARSVEHVNLLTGFMQLVYKSTPEDFHPEFEQTAAFTLDCIFPWANGNSWRPLKPQPSKTPPLEKDT